MKTTIVAAASILLLTTLAVRLAAADDVGPLAKRVQALEDREEIRALLIAYGKALDTRDFAAFADLFAKDDGEWVGGFGSAKGRKAIFDLMDKSIGNGNRKGPPSFHVFSNERIDVDGDRASATTKWVYVAQGDDGNPRWVYLGHYDDTFIREDGRWRFLRREAFTDIPAQQ